MGSFGVAAVLATFYLHLERQTEYVVAQMTSQIDEIERAGEAQ